MGTTESILYDDSNNNADDYEEDDEEVTEERLVPTPPFQPRTAAIPPQSSSSSSHNINRPRDNVVAGTSSPRRRPRPSSAVVTTRKPTQIILKGCVLGMAKSGKSSLLERFQGREPRRHNNTKAPRRHRENNTGQTLIVEKEDQHDEKENEVIDIPYKAPADAPTWHDRIRLHITAGPKVVSPPKTMLREEEGQLDFFIILIDPRKSAVKTKKYLTKLLRSAVKRARTSSKGHAALCCCLLRSFRDAIHEDEDDVADKKQFTKNAAHDENETPITTSSSILIQSSDLTSWTLECLGELPDLIDSSQLILQNFDVSLRDCYGLTQLHQFIYQCYAQQHIQQLKIQLERTVIAQRTAVQTQIPYKEFHQQQRQALATEKDHPPSNRPIDRHSTTATIEPNTNRRTILPQRPLKSQDQPTFGCKEALEAFLESDDEDSVVMTKENSRDTLAQSIAISDEAHDKDDDEEERDDDTINLQSDDASTQDPVVQYNPLPQTTKPHQDPEEPSLENHTLPAAGEPTADTSKTAMHQEPIVDTNKLVHHELPTQRSLNIDESFFEDSSYGDDESGTVLPIVATGSTIVASNIKNDSAEEDDDDEAFFISQIQTDDMGQEEDVITSKDAISSSRIDTVEGEASSLSMKQKLGRSDDVVGIKDYNPDIKAAIEAAKQDFQRILNDMAVPESSQKPKKSKTKKDPDKKKRKDRDKKVKKPTKDG